MAWSSRSTAKSESFGKETGELKPMVFKPSPVDESFPAGIYLDHMSLITGLRPIPLGSQGRVPAAPH